MKLVVILFSFIVLFAFNAKADDCCACSAEQQAVISQKALIKLLKKSDMEFTSSIENVAVRGMQNATYYQCEGKSGFLLVKLHDKEILYKDVPLKIWFELKFADSIQSYYKDQIKYNYISI